MNSLSRLEGVPLYVKIREALRQEIESGTLNHGDRLPSEDELASRHGVSRMTVRQSITDLIGEGLLYRRHGVGTFVSHHHVERDHSKLTNFFEASREEGVQVSAKVLRLEALPARLQVARGLNLQEGDPVICIETMRFVDNVPITLHEAYLPYNLFPQLLQSEINPQELWAFYEKQGYRVKRAVQRVEAKEASQELADLMEMDEGAPILYKERTLFADNGTPIEFVYCYNRGDMYSLTVTLSR